MDNWGPHSRQYKLGQIFSIDALIAGIILISIIATSFLLWESINEKARLIDESTAIDFAARNALLTLLNTPGVPHNWTKFTTFGTEQVVVLGVGRIGSETLDLDKVKKLVDLNSTNYNDYKTILGLNRYDFQVTFDVWQGNNYVTDYTIGASPDTDADFKVSHYRYALMNNTRTRVRMIVW